MHIQKYNPIEDRHIVCGLIKAGIVNQSAIETCMIENDIHPEEGGVVEKLLDAGFISEEDVARAIALSQKTEYIDLRQEHVSRNSIELMVPHIALFLQSIPYKESEGVVWVATSLFPSESVVDGIRFFCGHNAKVVITTIASVRYALNRYYPTSDITTRLRLARAAEESLSRRARRSYARYA